MGNCPEGGWFRRRTALLCPPPSGNICCRLYNPSPDHRMPDSFDQLAALIRARFSELSPQFQMGAGFLLDHPDEVAVSSMRKVAERAQVQPASLVRLSQQLGFPGWNELRNLFVA